MADPAAICDELRAAIADLHKSWRKAWEEEHRARLDAEVEVERLRKACAERNNVLQASTWVIGALVEEMASLVGDVGPVPDAARALLRRIDALEKAP